MDIGDVIDGKYELMRMLGRGGMGTVYLAEHKLLGKKVAIKLLHEQFAGNSVFVERFYKEARSAASVGHRGIVEVHDIGQTAEGALFLVMEFLDGQSLSALLKAWGKLDVREVVDIAAQVLSALAAVHAQGIVHRDLKPGNIFLCAEPEGPTIVKLLDFGVSKMTKGVLPDITSDKDVVGTLSYMAPEQARRAKDADHQSDLWAVGAIAYQMLVGHPPFKSGSIDQLLIRLMEEEIVPPKQLRDDVPDALDAAIMKALQRDVASRYSDAKAFRSALLEIRRPGGALARDEDGPTDVFKALIAGAASVEDDATTEASSESSLPEAEDGDEDTEVSASSEQGGAISSQASRPEAAVAASPHSSIYAPATGPEKSPAGPVEPSSSSGPLDTLAAVATNVKRAIPARTMLVAVVIASAVVFVVGATFAGIVLLGEGDDAGRAARDAVGSARPLPPPRPQASQGDDVLESPVGHQSIASANGLGETPPGSDVSARDPDSGMMVFDETDASGGVGRREPEATAVSASDETRDPVTVAEVYRELTRVRAPMQRCLGTDSSSPSRVHVTVRVDGDGAASLRHVQPTPSASVVQCIGRVVRGLSFRSAGGDPVEAGVTYTSGVSSDEAHTERPVDESSTPTPATTSLKQSPFRR